MKLPRAAAALLALAAAPASAFVVAPPSAAFVVAPAATRAPSSSPSSLRSRRAAIVLRAAAAADDDDEDDEDEKPVNPYADPNYPDLEFINYSDPEYQVDQGVSDEFFPATSSALSEEDAFEKVEEMREDRRKRNDEYQFETYHEKMLREGEEFRGEWTVYRTSTFLPGDDDGGNGATDHGMPKLVKARKAMRVISSGRKISVETDSDWRVDGERIVHEERMESHEEGPDGSTKDVSVSLEETFGSDEDKRAVETVISEQEQTEREILGNRYWPEEMSSYDFRGHQGIMCVGNSYTICETVPLNGGEGETADPHTGPFLEYKAELGLQYKRMRFRLKLDYRALEAAAEADATAPPLYLRSMTVCRETRERWPRHSDGRTDVEDASSAALFGPPGAEGGLYDPPLVGDDDQASRYMLLDLEGGATVLLPYRMDQCPNKFDGNGWVTSLDWTPGRLRYQVDRKVLGGAQLKGLRTLELSEVVGAEAEQWRPKDGGSNMRQ